MRFSTALAKGLSVGALALTGACASTQITPLEQATSLAREHREADAVRILREHLRAHPDDISSRRMLVRVLALTGDVGAARQEVEVLAQKLGASDPLPFIELGHAYELTHDYEKALEMYDHAAELAPADARGPREGGMRAAHWGEVEWARPRLEEAARRGANDAAMWHALGLLRLHQGDIEGAALAYRTGLLADPKALDCHLGLATIAVTRGDAPSALVEYEIILAERPRWTPGHLGRAWALARLGRKAESQAERERAASLPSAPTGANAEEATEARGAPNKK